jgi:putative spermidine/putrescine transport system substrate-binding protein
LLDKFFEIASQEESLPFNRKHLAILLISPMVSFSGCKSHGKELVVISYPGEAQVPYRKFLADPFEKQHPGLSIRLVPSESEDVVAQIKAAHGVSPYDVITLGEPRQISAVQEGWIEQTPRADLPNLKNVYPEFIKDCRDSGVPETYSLIGLAYNPDKVPAPTSWADLWNPAYRGKLGMTTPASNLGFALVIMAARLSGGSVQNLEPAWAKLHELGPFVVAPEPEQLAQLFERGEVSIAPMWNNDAAILASHGLHIKFVQPQPGGILVVSCMDVIKTSGLPQLARAFINEDISDQYQDHLAHAPWFFGPTDRNIKISPEAAPYMPTDEAGLKSTVHIDWQEAVKHRAEVIERFNREFSR